MTHETGMPGPIHDGLLALLLNSRPLVFDLAARCGARLHGGHEELSLSPDVFQDPGVPGRQFIADAVLIGWAIVDGELVEVDGVVLEIQLKHDGLKLISWVIYRAGVRSRHRCRGWTLVVSPEADVRQRARELFEHEPELGPLIVEPDLIPQIVNFSQARQEPEMTILSAVMHARSEAAVACGRAALVALLAVPRENQQCYLDLVSACLTEDQMAEAAQQLPTEVEIELSKMELESYAYAKGLRLGREAGVEEGRKEGRKEGRTEGRKEGRTEGSREALQAACAAVVARLRTTLAQRGIELDPASRSRIDRCLDLDQLSVWLVRAATATSIDELFDDPA
jgi:hypothetical protein